MDPKLIQAVKDQMPSFTVDENSTKINQAGLYGTFGQIGKSQEPELKDEQITILGLAFEKVDLYVIPGPSPLRRVIFIIEDIATGDVQVQESSRKTLGINLIKQGKLGTIFEKRFGPELHFDKIRVWVANGGGEIEKYHIETYLLARLCDKRRAEERARVMRRSYDRMTLDQRTQWRCRYPYAAEVVLKDHDDYILWRGFDVSDSSRDKSIVKRISNFVADHRDRIKPEALATIDAFLNDEALHRDVLFSYAVKEDDITGCTYSYRGDNPDGRTVVEVEVTTPTS